MSSNGSISEGMGFVPPQPASSGLPVHPGEEADFLRRLINHTLDIVCVLDDQGHILFVNAAAQGLLGYEPAELLHARLADLLHPEDQTLAAEEIRLTLAGASRRATLDVRCRHREGHWRVLEAAGNPLPGANPPRLVVIARDITERQRITRLQEALSQLGEATRSARTAAELFAATHRVLRNLVPADNFFIAQHDPGTDWLHFPYWSDLRDPGPPPHAPSTGLTDYVLRHNQTLHLTPDTMPGFLAASGAEVLGSLPAEWIGVPLRTADGVLGVMVLQSYDGPLGGFARTTLEMLATPLVLAMESLTHEEARAESEHHYRGLFTEMSTAFWVAQLEPQAGQDALVARVVECNRAMERLLNKNRADLVGRTLGEILADDRPDWISRLEEVSRTGQPLNLEWETPNRGRHLHLHIYRSRPGQVAGLASDISARKQTEQALRRRDALLEALAYTAERFLRTSDWETCAGEVLGALGRAAEVSRVYIFQNECTPAGQLVSSQRYEWVADGITPQIGNPRRQKLSAQTLGLDHWQKELFEGRLVAGDLSRFSPEERALFADQQVKSVLLVPVFAGGMFWGFLGVDECRRERAWMASEKDAFRSAAQTLGEAIQRRHAEEAMRVRSAALASAANGIVITDDQGHIIFVNQAFQKLTGYTAGEVIGHTPAILKSGQHDDAFYRRMWQDMRDGLVWQGEITNKRKDGTLYQEEMTITPVRNPSGKVTHFIAIKQDISERRNLQQQLQQAQKMESIGRLAGGIAHDFNNLLQAITGFSSILLSDLGEGDPRRGDVEEIDRAAQRAVALTRQLLAFSRKQKMEMTAVDLNQVVQGTEKMLRRLIGENIALETDLAGDLPAMQADSGQLEQVVVNLAVNARDAMPEGGRLVMRTRAVDLEAQARPDMGDARPGPYLVLSIIDDGTGMTPEVRERIFEPFFSAKGPGKGTGLGLAVVYGIVRQHGGFIDVITAPGAGTSMCIYLPVESGGAGAAGRGTAEPQSAPASRGRSERILIVEDEPGVRELTARILRDHRYRVVTADSCAEARRQIQSDPLPFDLLVSDVILPDGNGILLADELTAARPTLPVLLCSAYSDEQARSQMIQARGYRFLSKPYPTAALLREIRLLLDRIPPS